MTFSISTTTSSPPWSWIHCGEKINEVNREPMPTRKTQRLFAPPSSSACVCASVLPRWVQSSNVYFRWILQDALSLAAQTTSALTTVSESFFRNAAKFFVPLPERITFARTAKRSINLEMNSATKYFLWNALMSVRIAYILRPLNRWDERFCGMRTKASN